MLEDTIHLGAFMQGKKAAPHDRRSGRTIILAVQVAAEPGNPQNSMARLYTEDLTHHLDSIIAEHPARAFAVRPAVDAHLRGEYALSVPLFFAQAEGVCFENARKYLFQGQSDERVSHVAQRELEALSAAPSDNPVMGFYSLLYEIMWTSISERLPIAYNNRDRERFDYNGLNRNTVLHGLAMEEYATEEIA